VLAIPNAGDAVVTPAPRTANAATDAMENNRAVRVVTRSLRRERARIGGGVRRIPRSCTHA
jgi:hypothetical protein